MNARQTSSAQNLWGIVPLLFLTAAFATLPTDANAVPNAGSQRLDFDVFLGDRPIGNHEFELHQSSNKTTVTTSANFKVKLLFVTAFDYQHSNVETWQNDCLKSINAVTVVNGETFEVDGNQTGSAFTLRASEQNAAVNCARSFAYWDRSLLQSSTLLNSQTGEYVPTQLTAIGDGAMEVGGSSIPVSRYKLSGDDLQVTLAYTTNELGEEEWVGLSSKVKGGRTLNYIRTPESLELGNL